MLKKKTIEMEWTRLDGNKCNKRPIFRVIKDYKNSMLIGFFIGVCLVMGVTLVGQVVGTENKPFTTHGIKKVYFEDRSSVDSKQTGVENNESIDNMDISETMEESFDEPLEDSLKDPNEFNPPVDEKRFTVLFVGTDQRLREESMSNTDTLIVASINIDNGKVSLLSIPRDTQVTIPSYGKEKINAAARLGKKGLRTTEELIEQLTGLTINGYVLTNFTGFKEIIDTLGGITITIEKDMYYITGDKEDGIINLNKGTQRLNGTKALQYVRFRQDSLGDISRVTRQQAVIKAMEKEFLQMKTVPKLPWLITQMVKSVDTNLTVGELLSLANLILRHDTLDITSQTLPGKFLIENDISYWKVNPPKAKVAVKRLLEEGKASSVFFDDGARGE